jgi:polyisoprenoid-binding protein YceI
MEDPTAAPVEPTPTLVEVTQPPEQASPTQPDPPQPQAEASLTIYKIVPGESTVTYEVGETFFNQNNRFNLAVGVTPQVTGDIQVDTANPQNSKIGEVQVDVSQFKSDSGRRDGAIRSRFLQSATYPIATFTPTSFEGLPDTYTEGQEITFKVTGDLTIKEATKPVTFDVTVKLEGGTLTGTATTTILMSDFGVGPIELAGMLGTEDQVKLTMAFVARP